jgi:chaperonin GroES
MLPRPLGNLAIIEAEDVTEKVTSGGIVMPQTHYDPSHIGRVLAYGKGLLTEDGRYLKEDIKKGDRVVFKRYMAYEVKIKGEELFLVPDTDILAVLDDENKVE